MVSLIASLRSLIIAALLSGIGFSSGLEASTIAASRSKVLRMIGAGAPPAQVDSYVMNVSRRIAGRHAMEHQVFHVSQEIYGVPVGRYVGTRIDGRSPAQILEAGGFYPQSNKLVRTHLGHVMNDTRGLVSFSVGPRISRFVDGGYAWGGLEGVTMLEGMGDAQLAHFESIQKAIGSTMRNWPQMDFGKLRSGEMLLGTQKRYVYTVKGAAGWETPAAFMGLDHGYQTEREFVSLAVPSRRILNAHPVVRLISFNKVGTALEEVDSKIAVGAAIPFPLR